MPAYVCVVCASLTPLRACDSKRPAWANRMFSADWRKQMRDDKRWVTGQSFFFAASEVIGMPIQVTLIDGRTSRASGY